METVEIRRARLKAWFKERTLPEEEKSYLSQLINGKSSFGEKAARRIENTYKMPVGYLDAPLDAETPRDMREHRDLLEAWEYLLPGEQTELLDDIKKRAEHNKAVMNQLAPPDVHRRTVIVADRRKANTNNLPFADRRKKNG